MDAYLAGLEDRSAANEPIDMIASLRHFLSRAWIPKLITSSRWFPLRVKRDRKCKKATPYLNPIFITSFATLKVRSGARVQRRCGHPLVQKIPLLRYRYVINSSAQTPSHGSLPHWMLRDHGKASVTIRRGLNGAQKLLTS